MTCLCYLVFLLSIPVYVFLGAMLVYLFHFKKFRFSGSVVGTEDSLLSRKLESGVSEDKQIVRRLPQSPSP